MTESSVLTRSDLDFDIASSASIQLLTFAWRTIFWFAMEQAYNYNVFAEQ